MIKGSQSDGARRSPSTLGAAETVKYPERLHYAIPAWVRPGSVFHVRVRCARDNRHPLTGSALGEALLGSAKFYHARHRWWANLFLLMPDHWHALISFPRDEAMSDVIGDWKRFQSGQHGVVWQEGYFDHRIRSDAELQLKAGYILKNPVVAGRCARPEDWPWVWPKG